MSKLPNWASPLLVRLSLLEPIFSVLSSSSAVFSDKRSGSAMLISNLAILRFPVLLTVSSMSCRVPCLPSEVLRRDESVMLSMPTAWRAPTCHADVESIARYFGTLAGRLDTGIYTDDCSASGCSDLDELTICCRRLSCPMLEIRVTLGKDTYPWYCGVASLVT